MSYRIKIEWIGVDM